MISKSRSNKGDSPGVLAVRSAAKLLLHTADYWQDEKLQSQEYEIDYAVDTDIIKLFSEPEAKQDYAQVFDGDKETGTSGLLSKVLGEFILKEMGLLPGEKTKRKNLIVIPPHDDELDRLILAIVNNTQKGNESSINSLGVAIEAAQVESGDDLVTVVRKLVAQSPDLIAAIDPDTGPMAEAKRLASLPKSRLINLRRYYLPVDQGGILPAGCAVLPPSPENATRERDIFIEYVKVWSDRLKKYSPRNKPIFALRDDSIVLATLQWVNERLAAERFKRRLVLITGSKYIFDAAHGQLKNSSGQDFVEQYLRHPQAFLATQRVFPDRANWIDVAPDHDAILKWLLLFFPAAVKSEMPGILPINRILLNQIADGKDEFISATVAHLVKVEYQRTKHAENFPNELLENWRDVIRSAAISRGLMPSGIDKPNNAEKIVRIISESAQAGWSIKEFKAALQAQGDAYLTDLLLSTSRLGVMQLNNSDGDDSRVRGLPAVRFDEPYAEAQKTADELTHSLLSAAQSQISIDIGKLYESLERQDDSNYHALVIHALAYGSKHHWTGARTLCQAAIRVSDRLPEKDKNQRLGREAAYLLAVAERRLARSPEDIRKAGATLDDAIKRDPEPSICSPDLRFQAENLAQVAWFIQYDFYCDGLLLGGGKIEDFFSKTELVINGANARERGAIKNWVIRQAVTNALFVLFVGLLSDSIDIGQDKLRTMGRQLLGHLEWHKLCPRSASSQQQYCDAMSDYAYAIGTIVWGGGGDVPSIDVASFSQSLPQPPFDKHRRERLRKYMNL